MRSISRKCGQSEFLLRINSDGDVCKSTLVLMLLAGEGLLYLEF